MRTHDHLVSLFAIATLFFASGCRVEAPGAPQSLAATRGNGQVALQWDVPARDGGKAITGYRVNVAPGGATVSVEPSKRSLSLDGLTNGTLYTLSVSAVNEVGEGEPATTTAVPANVPEAPSALAAVGGVGEATLTWTAPSETGGIPLTAYRVTPFIGATAQPSQDFPAPATGALVTGLQRGMSFVFTVTALNEVGAGAASAPSNSISTPDYSSAPTGLVVTRGNAQVQVGWSPPASDGGRSISGYVVTPYVGGMPQTPVVLSGTSTSTWVSGLANGTAYTFRVAATNAVGTGPDSAPSASVTPATVPSPPGNLKARAGNTEATISWSPAGNGGDPVTSYTVTVSPGGGTATSAGTSLTFQGLTNGASYTFTVTATNSVGTSLPTSPSGTVIPGPIPADCAGALLQNPAAASGVFSISVQGTQLDVYCDMATAGGGWTLVYKLSTGISGDAAAIWDAVTPQHESDPAYLTLTTSPDHYLSSIVTDHWNTGGVAWSEARVAVYTGGAERAFLRFDATGSTRDSWFALAHVTGATWADLSDGQNFFGIQGDWAVKRNWFVNNVYGACGGDVGWLAVSTGGIACTWESSHGAPVRILYAPGTVKANWTTGASVAEVLAVFVR